MAAVIRTLRNSALLLLLLATAASAASVKIGKLTYFLGNGATSGNSDASGTGSSGASFNGPGGCAIDESGNLFITDTNNHVVRKVFAGSNSVTTFAGQSGQTGDSIAEVGINALFGTPFDLAFLKNGYEGFLVDASNHRIYSFNARTSGIGRFAGDGTPGLTEGTSEGAQLNGPTGIVIALGSSDMYVTERFGHRVRKFDITAASASYVGSTDGTSGDLEGNGGDARMKEPAGITMNQANGKIYVADSGNKKIRVIADSVMKTLAGTGTQGAKDGPGAQAQFVLPWGVVVDRKNGYVYVADRGNNVVRRVDIVTRYVDTVIGTLAAGWIDSLSSIKGRITAPRGLCQDLGKSTSRLYVTGDHAVSYVQQYYTHTESKTVRVGETPAPIATPQPATPAPPATTRAAVGNFTQAPQEGVKSAASAPSVAVVVFAAVVAMLAALA